MKQASPRSPASAAQQQQQQPAPAGHTSPSRPYETRRKSLSLPALGIALPGKHSQSSRKQQQQQQQQQQQTVNTDEGSSSGSTAASPSPATGDAPDAQSLPEPKRVKRTHSSTGSISSSKNVNTSTQDKVKGELPSRPRKSSIPGRKPLSAKKLLQQQNILAGSTLTPPPSPRDGTAASGDVRVDTDGINDDIVVGVIQLLESTGNRPHLIKEFAAILRSSLASVEGSANAPAIISSRLTNYLRRPWTALAPCPLTKEQVTTHPRRVYYYLTTIPRQPIPEYVEPPASTARISPSASSNPDGDDDVSMFPDQDPDANFADAFRASPEVEFVSADAVLGTVPTTEAPPPAPAPFDDEEMGGFGAFTDDAFGEIEPAEVLVRNNRRALSPPLEHDEREFTMMASSMQLRRATEQLEQQQQQLLSAAASPGSDATDGSSAGSTPAAIETSEPAPDAMDQGLDEESLALANRKCVAELFGGSSHFLSAIQNPELGSSPMLRPTHVPGSHGVLKSPENHTSFPHKKSVRILEGELTLKVPGRDSPAPGDVAMLDVGQGWDEMRSPEHVGLSELDDMFCDFYE